MNNKTENVLQYVLNGERDFEISDADSDVEVEHYKVIFHEADDEFAHRNVLLEVDDEFAHRNVLLEVGDEIADVEPVNEEIEEFSDNETLSNKTVSDEKHHWSKHDSKSFDTVFRELELEPPVDEECSPYEYFKRFVTNEMLQDIAEQTNIYSMQKYGKNVNLISKEVDKFIGVYFRMGLV